MSTDTEALLATVRETAHVLAAMWPDDVRFKAYQAQHDAALDSLAAELERVKAERDEWRHEAESRMEMEQNAPEAEARLDKALAALREIATTVTYDDTQGKIARAVIAEIEGEA